MCDAAGQCTVTYDYTGGPQQWVTPPNVHVASISIFGAQRSTAAEGAPGGLGAQVDVRFGTSPGAMHQILIGAHPAPGQTNVYGGGGVDGSSGYGCNLGGPGGGASSVLADDGAIIAIAGGGGGGGGHGYGSRSGQGGAGGPSGGAGTVGEAADAGFSAKADGGGGADGATPSTGGSGGVKGYGTYFPEQSDRRTYGESGTLGRGGGGQQGWAVSCDNAAGASGHGGGGGGGYHGRRRSRR